MSFRGINTTVIQIRRQVFTEVARMAYANVKGEQANHLMRKIPYTIIPGEEGKLRKDIFLERAIVEERVRLAMGLPTRRMDEHNSVVSGLEDASIQGWARQPWHRSETLTSFSGQRLQANLITFTSGGS